MGSTSPRNQPRWGAGSWLVANDVAAGDAAIVDDAFDMGELAHRHLRISPLCGFDDDAAVALRALFGD